MLHKIQKRSRFSIPSSRLFSTTWQLANRTNRSLCTTPITEGRSSVCTAHMAQAHDTFRNWVLEMQGTYLIILASARLLAASSRVGKARRGERIIPHMLKVSIANLLFYIHSSLRLHVSSLQVGHARKIQDGYHSRKTTQSSIHRMSPACRFHALSA